MTRMPCRALWALLAALAASACQGETVEPSDFDAGADAAGVQADTAAPTDPDNSGNLFIPAEPQRDGDPERGYQALLSGAYVGCGLPRRLWDFAVNMGAAPGGPPAPGSDTGLPYYLSQFETPRGVDVVAPNCLTCHAGELMGELVIGTGGLTFDFGGFANQMSQFDDSFLEMAEQLLNMSEDESFELRKFYGRLQAVAPYVQSQTIGASAADNLAAILFAHRDPQTLAWSDEPLIDPPPEFVVPLSVPPWWRMRDRSSMLYVAAGRGDLSRIMMAASVLCVDDLELARQLDADMPHIYAYLRSLQPPPYPFEIDQEAAARGEEVFEGRCTRCHGSYGDEPNYPNLVTPLEIVGTDPALALGGSNFADRFVEWFNGSAFFGEISRLEPEAGYVAPPLDGIWAAAPYLHNGSVPTLAALLDPSLRPTFWTWSYDTSDYDSEAVGWNHQELDYGQDGEPDPERRRLIYDTTLLGFSNEGHTYGNLLDEGGRSDLLEYLKTL